MFVENSADTLDYFVAQLRRIAVRIPPCIACRVPRMNVGKVLAAYVSKAKVFDCGKLRADG